MGRPWQSVPGLSKRENGSIPITLKASGGKMSEITGYARKDGKFGIRNHVLVLPAVSCVNGVINRISRQVPEAVCITHAHGCGRGGVRDMEIALRILSGMILNPNVGA